MTNLVMVIEDKESKQGEPKYIFVTMEDPFVGANTWRIDTPNSWIGMAKGEYKKVGFSYDTLEFREGRWEEGNDRFKLLNIKYPSDCKPKAGESVKTGQGLYLSPYSYGGGSRKLEWSGRNIIPES